ncbi:SH3 domain-containing protein [Clostridium perfringens]|nr:SH3 domain-containing protein [Clostridium perfringens]MDU4522535.1 SH3 domain-containing protein [Clostridioides difficile]MDK0530718.1 SH3 domain-containing protein [Clostridium perfringens]MDK0557480.1 SH3 domain-containing protein [Clostridium perfringens]MDK0598889.1 SH3 domain-containing protein [Clostridium perfringens]MDK0669392.1 SH3 domain-containing protein [Clostridium perfringens]
MANNIIPNVSSGDLVGSTPTFPPNAVVRGDFLYLRDVDGNQIPGRTVSDGDEITVLFISNEKNIVLVQYPTSSGYRQGYVTNATSIIKYKDDYSWVNGSTPEPVYDFDKTTQIGTLDPRERAVVLYKVDGMTYVAYDTGKGKLTKSGLVHYEGSGSSTGGGSFNGVAPGEVVPGGFTYENNAEVVGDELYLRDANGNLIPGRSVSVGDKITVLDVSYSKQLALVQYPAGNVVRQGYVTNATNLIRYFNQSMWHNGSTPEEVLDENGGHLGSLDPYESATPLYKKNGMTHVVYNTSKGPNTKSGYVKYEGSAATRVDIPRPSITNAQKIVYGTSGRGRELAAYKVGNGANSLIYVCAIHGWEDHWAADGIELTRIGNGLIEHFQNAGTNNWSLYIIPVANPDGLSEGYTNNGPGRCTIVGAVDCNRDFPIGFTPYGDSRHWTNKEPLSVPESRSLRDFISEIKGKTSGSTYLIDMHGWEDKTIGDSHISRAFQNQFGFVNGNYDGVYQAGFLISWANSIGVRAALIELPQSCYSHSDAVNGRYLQKSINAVTNLIGGSDGSSSGGSTGGSSGSDIIGGSSSSDKTYISNGEVINVQSFLNVRKGPGTDYDSIGQLHQGDKVSIVAKNGEWYKISSPIAGYVHSDFINIIEIGEPKNEEINNKALEKIKLIMSALSKNVDITGERQFGHPLDIYDHIIKVTATFGIEAYTNSKAQIKFKITDKNFDDSTLIGMFTKKGVSYLSIYSDFIKEFITKSTIAFENGDIELSYDISKLNLEIKYSSYIKGNSESDLGAKVYFKIGFSLSDNIKNQIIDDVKSYINKVIDDIKRCIENVIEKIDNTSIRDEIISLSLITMFVMLYNKSKNFINGNLKLEALVASFLVFISSTNVVELNKKVNEFFGV